MTYIDVRQCRPVCIICAMWTVYRDTMLRYSLNFGSNMIILPRVVCATVCVPSPYSSIPREKRQSYVILIEFGWHGLKVSEVDNLEKRKFLEAIASHPYL